MNAHAMASTIAEELAAEFPGKVVPLKPVPAARPNADRLADFHRRESLACHRRIADAKRQGKKDDAAFVLARKTAKAEYDAKLLEITEAEAFSKEIRAEGIAEDERLSRYNSAALAALGG